MKRIKVIITSLLIVILILAAGGVPIGAQAACSTPTCVKKAATVAMDENDSTVAFVIRFDAKTHKGTGYMMYKTSANRVKCDRSGAVIVGKNENIKQNYHYYVNRNSAAEKKVINWTKDNVKYRERWNTIVECAEDADFNLVIHSYIEYKYPNKSWVTCKGISKNVNGISMCKDFAHYLRSMLDPDCPVIFIIV